MFQKFLKKILINSFYNNFKKKSKNRCNFKRIIDEEGNMLAIFNSANLLEISIMRRNTSETGANLLLGIEEKDNILIDY